MGLRFEVFGGVRVVTPTGPLPLRPQVARVLGILLAEPGVPVPVERIVDRLWRSEPPATATKVVHVSVGRLRKALDAHDGNDAVRTTSAGYLVAHGPHDLEEYEHARAQVDALRIVEPERALAAGRVARAAWRGRPWGEDADADWIADRVRALEESSRALTETLGDLMLDVGRPDDAVVALRDAVVAEPLRERRWAQLMTALYRDGRQADALAAYEQVRRLLRDELGIEPGPELRRLQLAVLQQDPLLLRSAPARADVHAPTSFVGRADELRALDRAVDRDRLVCVTGIGGIGKTRLVTEYAHRRALSGEAVHRISFSGLEATERFDDHAAPQVGLYLEEHATLAPALAARVGDGAALVVVDAADQVTERVGHLALTLIEACPRVRIVVTARVPLGLGVEREFHLGALPAAEPGRPVAGTDLELMLDRAGFDPATLGEAALDEMRATCRAAGGVPLLIELSARTPVLDGGDDARPASDREPVRAAIAHALDAVDEPARTLVTRAAVLPGGITDAIAAGVTDGDVDGARRRLRQLAWVHLVDAFPGGRSVRYRSLDPIRASLLDDLDATDREAALAAATATLQSLVDRIWPDHTQPVVLPAVDVVADEHDNLRFLLADRIRHAPTAALDLAIGASDFWALRGHVVEGQSWIEEAMTASTPTGLLRARALLALARTARTMAETAELHDRLEAAAADVRDGECDDVILGGLVVYLAIARAWHGDRVGASECLDEARRLDAAIGTPWTRAQIDHLRVLDAALTGDFERARAGQRSFAEQMLALDDLVGAATGHYLAAMLGDMMGPTGELAEIRADVATSRALAETVGDISLLSRLLLLEARVLERSHDPRSRAALADAAARLAEQGGIAAAAQARRDLGLMALREGATVEAERILTEAAPVLLRLDRPASAPAWAGLAALRAEAGDADTAALFASAARSLGASDAPQWVADRARVAELLGAVTGDGPAAPPPDDELLARLGS